MHDGVSLKRSGFCEACVLEHNVGSLIDEDKAHSKHDYNPHFETSQRLGKMGMRKRRRSFRESLEEIGS